MTVHYILIRSLLLNFGQRFKCMRNADSTKDVGLLLNYCLKRIGILSRFVQFHARRKENNPRKFNWGQELSLEIKGS